jgi:hypothetical protein
MPNLVVRDSGTHNHSRWLTCANRVLRLYISEIKPFYELKTLTSYIMKMYASVWFDIKRNH